MPLPHWFFRSVNKPDTLFALNWLIPTEVHLLCLCWVSAPEKIQRKNDSRCHKQQVNQTGGNKAAIKPN
jgi:hypothetical protein